MAAEWLRTEGQTAGVLHSIYFAGGCFWGVQEYFSRVEGVCEVSCGYANGATQDPTYEEVCSGYTGYAEAVCVAYDPAVVCLKKLAERFFSIIDPLSLNRQGMDVGTQYRSGVYYTGEADRAVLQEVFATQQQRYDQPIVTELLPLERYCLAEEYHQNYLKKNPRGYCHINLNSL
ncbi:MAG: peptide-methionine (S)-S-oxide reductase MsrA [Coriobacteriales bacterium]|jgi:peptide methionine sulfoxide reductase msrA/msrB|nr:peptide-methionine (S)-S-oxide reductase MsrA [Coriobacteriales bacterium]